MCRGFRAAALFAGALPHCRHSWALPRRRPSGCGSPLSGAARNWLSLRPSSRSSPCGARRPAAPRRLSATEVRRARGLGQSLARARAADAVIGVSFQTQGRRERLSSSRGRRTTLKRAPEPAQVLRHRPGWRRGFSHGVSGAVPGICRSRDVCGLEIFAQRCVRHRKPRPSPRRASLGFRSVGRRTPGRPRQPVELAEQLIHLGSKWWLASSWYIKAITNSVVAGDSHAGVKVNG